jgi:glutamyl/glutaminyl-tRNA synthetase
MYDFFGWKRPRFLHTVLLRDAQKRKLSKRSGDTSIRWFEYQGYVPDGFRNFITRVMWAHPGDKDVYPYQEFIDLMKTSDLPATGPVADFALLGFINGKYIADLTAEERYNAVNDYVEKLLRRGEGLVLEIYNGEQRDTIEYSDITLKKFAASLRRDPGYSKRALALEPERLRRLGDVFEQYSFLFPDLYAPPPADLVTKTAGSADAARDILSRFVDGLVAGETLEAWDARLKGIVEARGDKPKAVFMTIRLAVTGREKSPPVYDMAQILGIDEIKRRVAATVAALG